MADDYRIHGPVTSQSIKALAAKLVTEHINEHGWRLLSDFCLDLNEIYESVLYPRYEYKVESNYDLGFRNGQKVLGKTIPKDRVVLIDKSLVKGGKDSRYPFTYGHEFGHAILHPEVPLFRCVQQDIFAKRHSDKKEVQANLFSEHFLMPDGLVAAMLDRCYDLSSPIRYIGPREYWFEPYGARQIFRIKSYTHLCLAIAAPLCIRFANVSKTSLGLKIHKLRLILNSTNERFDLDRIKAPKIYGGYAIAMSK